MVLADAYSPHGSLQISDKNRECVSFICVRAASLRVAVRLRAK